MLKCSYIEMENTQLEDEIITTDQFSKIDFVIDKL